MKLWIRTPVALAALAVVVSFGACSDDDVTGGDDEPVDEATVEMQDNVFDPLEVRLNVGGTVTWVNTGAVAHTTTSDDWDSGSIATDGTFARAFPTAGTFEYECTIHDGMDGTIIVE